jgi:3-phosphoshikimate 1-carboxyvinyltransferase
MIVRITPSEIKGTILAPASKSSMQRACAAALLNEGETVIHNPGKSNDDKAALGVIKNLGATVTQQSDGTLLIKGSDLFTETTGEGAFSCGESGLGIRMFAPIAALSSQPITINGEGSLLTRPMDFFDEIFPQLGISIQSKLGKLPIKIKGPFQPKDITIDGSLSSQFLTGLLFAFGKAATQPVTITVTNLKSTPYIDLTLKVMQDFGYAIINNNYQSFTINPKPLNPKPLNQLNYTVEGDWSGASFLLVAGAIAGNIAVEGLDVFSTQADKKILEALRDSGCTLSIQEKCIEVACNPLGAGLKPFHFNATDCPDLFPPLVALAAYCNGKSVIEGVSRLAHKESDRAITLQQEFAKMGIEIDLQDDLMIVHGGTGVQGANVHSRHDHRIAMACAVAALSASSEVMIEEANAINKSYPDFYEHLKQLGVFVIS